MTGKAAHESIATLHTMPSSNNRFDDFFRDSRYLSLKKDLFSYRFRKWKIAKYVPSLGRILDIGSGTAPVSPYMARTVVADQSEGAMRNVECERKMVTSITNMPFDDATFECILCSEVLEHVTEDEKAVAELRRVLMPGGVLILTVPYQKRFWAEDDEYVEHVRRYDPGELEQKLAHAGFQQVTTHKMSGMIERWLTIRSLKTYQASGVVAALPPWLLRMVNSALFLLLVVAEPFISWNGTTRILVVAR